MPVQFSMCSIFRLASRSHGRPASHQQARNGVSPGRGIFSPARADQQTISFTRSGCTWPKLHAGLPRRPAEPRTAFSAGDFAYQSPDRHGAGRSPSVPAEVMPSVHPARSQRRNSNPAPIKGYLFGDFVSERRESTRRMIETPMARASSISKTLSPGRRMGECREWPRNKPERYSTGMSHEAAR
jgi:hypothetical protein